MAHRSGTMPIGRATRNTKSRYVMQVESIDDFRVILTGQSREYPGFKGQDWTGRPNMRGHVDWLHEQGQPHGQDRRCDHPQGRSLGRREAAASLMWAKLKNLEYRDLFWILLGSVLGQHLVRGDQIKCATHLY